MHLSQEMNTLQQQKDQAHQMLLRHHQCTQELEYKQLNAMHKLRMDQQGNIFENERDNQNEYNKKAEMELQKKHLLEIRQRPKTLKVCSLGYFFFIRGAKQGGRMKNKLCTTFPT